METHGSVQNSDVKDLSSRTIFLTAQGVVSAKNQRIGWWADQARQPDARQ